VPWSYVKYEAFQSARILIFTEQQFELALNDDRHW